MQTSARNQFLGTISDIKKGAVNSEVSVDIGANEPVCAVITNESLEHLDLQFGTEVYALIKASWVVLSIEPSIKSSARNHLVGEVVRIAEGAVSSEVILELAGGKLLTAVITNESMAEMQLILGMRAAGLIKASHIILAKVN